MRNLILVLFVFSLFALNQDVEAKETKIKGRVIGCDYKTMYFETLDKTIVDSIQMNDDGTFEGVINIEEEGIYRFKSSSGIYLVPGSDLVMIHDLEAVKQMRSKPMRADAPISNVLTLSGKGSDSHNIYDTVYRKGGVGFERGRAWYKLSPKEYADSIDHYFDEKLMLVDSLATNSNEVSETFINDMKFLISFKKAGYYQDYTFRGSGKDNLPEIFTTIVESVPLYNQRAYKNYFLYHGFVLKMQAASIGKMDYSKIGDASVKEYSDFLDKVENADVYPDVKEMICHQLFYHYGKMSVDLKALVIKRLLEISKDESFHSRIIKMSKEIDNMVNVGDAANNFTYPDINGKMVSLSDLKGFIVYIDVWATWCGPCRGEIPHLQKLEKELHGKEIKFVSISVDKDKEAWESLVKEKELGGIQLLDIKGQITSDYGIMGIPRFIVIDRKGNLVSLNALRPSDPKTKQMLLDLIEGKTKTSKTSTTKSTSKAISK